MTPKKKKNLFFENERGLSLFPTFKYFDSQSENENVVGFARMLCHIVCTKNSLVFSNAFLLLFPN